MLNVDALSTTTISWMLSSLSYNEKNIIDYVNAFLPKFRCHFKSEDEGSHFYGIVYQPDSDRIWLVNRGTDGFTNEGKLKSWLTNLNIFTGGDGVANGIETYGNTAFDAFKHTLENFDHIYVVGHSQGGSTAQYESCLCVENLTLKHCHFDIFGSPPAGNAVFAERAEKHITSGKLSGDRYIVYGDPINSPLLRDQSSLLLDGVDIGYAIHLPQIIKCDLGILNVINHSCMIYHVGLTTRYTIEGNASAEDYILMGKVALETNK